MGLISIHVSVWASQLVLTSCHKILSSGDHLNIKISSYQYRDSHYRRKTVSRHFVFLMQITFISLYWNGTLVTLVEVLTTCAVNIQSAQQIANKNGMGTWITRHLWINKMYEFYLDFVHCTLREAVEHMRSQARLITGRSNHRQDSCALPQIISSKFPS